MRTPLRTFRRRRPLIVIIAMLAVLLTVAGIAHGTVITPSSPAAAAKGGGGGGPTLGGTDGPPNPTPATPFTQTTLSTPANTTNAHQFDFTGFIQATTVSGAGCPGETNTHRFGGTLKINNLTITVPCNLIVQMPANTFTWADFVNGGPSLAVGAGYPSFELRVVGNQIGTKRIAALAFVSQQSLQAAGGTIKGFDFANGVMLVEDTSATAGTTTRVQINDPKTVPNGTGTTGRFSAGQSPDPRFSVDQANPTVRAGTGYPMCIPRVGTANVGGADPLCPQQNRPKPVNGQCRTFTNGGGVALGPGNVDLSLPPPGAVYCLQFLMPAPPTTAAGTTAGPDSRQQAPFEVGDYVNYVGTLTKGAAGQPDYISAHTIEANVGIYTQPGSKPNYVSVGVAVVGANDPAATGADVEGQQRLVLEAETTDYTTPVDMYMPDVDARSGTIHNRWISQYEMTSEKAGQTPSGGITTQYNGPVPNRVRERANKAPNGLLQTPSRAIRVATRNTCTPTPPTGVISGTDGTIPQAVQALDTCLDSPAAANYGIAANGLATGQYTSPVFDFIFPENLKVGDPLTANDFWHMGFLRFGENSTGANPNVPSVGPLTPSPW